MTKLLGEYDDKEIFEEAYRRKLFKIESENAVVKVKKTIYEDDITVVRTPREIYEYDNRENGSGPHTGFKGYNPGPIKISHLEPITLYSKLHINEIDLYAKGEKDIFELSLRNSTDQFCQNLIRNEKFVRTERLLLPEGGCVYTSKMRIIPWSK